MNFSAGITLSDKGVVVDNKLNDLREKMFKKDKSLNIGGMYRWLDTLVKSDLYDCFYNMPKPAVHHAHLTACATMEFLIHLTYFDSVFFSEKDNKFFASGKGCDLDGYIKVNTLRQYWKESAEFDKWLVAKMELRPDPETLEDHAIWEGFEYKFIMTNDLYNYAPFFERILYRISKNFVKEMVTVLELKHIFGFVFDDDHKPIGV